MKESMEEHEWMGRKEVEACVSCQVYLRAANVEETGCLESA